MTADEFVRNNRGINQGQDFPREYLETIYQTIRRSEIVMPEEHEGQVGEEYAWKKVLRMDKALGKLVAPPAFREPRDPWT